MPVLLGFPQKFTTKSSTRKGRDFFRFLYHFGREDDEVKKPPRNTLHGHAINQIPIMLYALKIINSLYYLASHRRPHHYHKLSSFSARTC